MTLSEYLDLWLETYIDPKRAENTGRAYRFALAHLSPAIRSTELDALTPLHLQKEVNQLAAVYSRQAQIMYTGLSAALRKAVRLDMIASSPMEKVEPPEHEKREIETLEPEEAAAYIQAAMEQPAGPLLILMLCLGLRRNEARGIRNEDLDPDGILHIRHQRTRDGLAKLKSKASRREIPVPVALRAFFEGTRGEFVVDVSEKSLRMQHLRVLSSIGVDRRVTLHGLRHTCATMAVEDGVQLATVQHLLGHAHYSLTADVYVHPDLRSLARCTDVIFGSFWHQAPGARLEIV